ncbi:hypothetical protein [Neorhodopirellula pilleata]|uniref:Uncharacterized protein n=1 Tax=Neorhodopirellula pilleata TaxID=2714738 RepID=A0A5C6A4D2_9BACT|nr:hypothetical protein [Neorhodopirellula pilleata]TWT94158.1 hypothetical protein Pla100_37670 [Neorhodopirellula pilleata]
MSKMLRIRSVWSLTLLFAMLNATTIATADGPSLLRMFSRGERIEADASKPYLLTQEDGPWMILAHTFLGPGSQERAERLVMEIRRDLNLPAFLYEKEIDFSGEVNPGSPIQRTGGAAAFQRKMRYANEIRYEAHAVLVGEYDTAEHPRVESDLEKIKTAQCGVFGDEKEMAAETDIRNPVTAVKALHHRLVKKMGDPKLGAMGNAFLTRNPMLPEDFFQAPEVDAFVRHLNEGKTHSLIDECPGKYTVVVRTFSGFNTIVDGKKDKTFEPSGERLDRCAADAAEMVRLLRKEGVEAYQFHDRTQSIVTIGSFENLGRELPGGGFEYDAPILAVMNEYRAFNIDANLANQVKQKTTQGVPVKCVAERFPFDVQPMPISVPKPSKRSLYSAAMGR